MDPILRALAARPRRGLHIRTLPLLACALICCASGVDEEFVEVENLLPRAALEVPAQARVGEALSCDGNSSTDPDGRITAFAWDFATD